jgi:hypothetical protein
MAVTLAPDKDKIKKMAPSGKTDVDEKSTKADTIAATIETVEEPQSVNDSSESNV